MIFQLLLLLLISPPESVNRNSYPKWLNDTNSVQSAFNNYLFDWYEQIEFPRQAYQDKDKIYVSVAHPLAETIELENAAEIEDGNTVGFEAYTVIDAPINIVLETDLFLKGKPIGKIEGTTYPFDSIFKFRQESLQNLGKGNYISTSIETNGGIVQDIKDKYTVLVRKIYNGYAIFTQYHSPAGNTQTQAMVSFIILQEVNGKTERSQSFRHNGQSYKVFGIEYGRRNFGFNPERVRSGIKNYVNNVMELKNTGKIRENL